MLWNEWTETKTNENIYLISLTILDCDETNSVVWIASSDAVFRIFHHNFLIEMDIDLSKVYKESYALRFNAFYLLLIGSFESDSIRMKNQEKKPSKWMMLLFTRVESNIVEISNVQKLIRQYGIEISIWWTLPIDGKLLCFICLWCCCFFFAIIPKRHEWTSWDREMIFHKSL